MSLALYWYMCMCVCMYIRHICVCMYIRHICTYTYINIEPAYMYTYIHICTYTNINIEPVPHSRVKLPCGYLYDVTLTFFFYSTTARHRAAEAVQQS